MYVPVDPQSPTWDRTVKIGFRQWLTSSKRQRQEWYRLRQAAARAQTLTWEAEGRERAERIARRVAGPQQRQRAGQTRQGSAWWVTMWYWSSVAEMLVIVLPILVFVACVAGAIWLEVT